jgi:hypothetical protein
MRRSAKARIAWSKPARKVVGYILGYEAFLQSDNARDLSLKDICGTDALNCLFEGATRVFYEDTLCGTHCRRQHIAQKLSFALIDALRDEGFTYLTGRAYVRGRRSSAVHQRQRYPKCSAPGICSLS